MRYSVSRFFVLFLCFSCSVLFAQVRFPHGSGVVDITKAPYNAKNDGKTDITGIIYEPWHFRYVGEDAAKIIMEKGITLEEYLTDYDTP